MKWEKPQIEELNIKMTANGMIPSDVERTGVFFDDTAVVTES